MSKDASIHKFRGTFPSFLSKTLQCEQLEGWKLYVSYVVLKYRDYGKKQNFDVEILKAASLKMDLCKKCKSRSDMW